MVEKQNNEDEKLFVTTSCELNSNDFQIVTPTDKNFVVIKSKYKVAIFCTKTTRLVSTLFKDESVWCIWIQKNRDGSETLCGLSQSGFILECKLVGNRTDEEEKKTPLPDFSQIPSTACYARALINSTTGLLDTVYYVTKDDDKEFSIISKSVVKKKILKFGKVTVNLRKNFMFAFNEVFMVKSGSAISGKPAIKLSFNCTSIGNRPWFQNIARERSITAIACHPLNDKIAITGDSKGRIQIWRQKNDFQFFATEVHWHSLPVSCFSFSPEGVYFFSGGGEGAILKWELVSGRRVALVPRLGSTVTAISASDASVIVSTDTNLLKVFTPNLDDDQMITGLTKEIQDSGIFWHPQTRCIVLKGSRRRVQFFDPLLKTQKLALDASSQDDVLGDRDIDKKSQSQMSQFAMSSCGNWLATVESNWDTMNGNCLKIWNYSNKTGQISFELNTRINGAHDGEINSLCFVSLKKSLGLITCGNEGNAKLWELGDQMRWQPVRTFAHVGCIPRCADSSCDSSVIAVGFDSKITLWNSEFLSLLSTLSTPTNVNLKSEDYTSLAFGIGHLLVAANRSSLHVWSLLTNQLAYKMSMEHSKLIRTPKTITITSSVGIYSLEDKMKLKCLSRKSAAHLSSLACSDSHCFIIRRTADQEDNELVCLPLDGDDEDRKLNEKPEVITTSHPAEMSLMTSSMGRVKLSQKEDMHALKLGPAMTASMISMPVSKNSLSLLKQSLPA